MCSIIGYGGEGRAARFLVNGLKRMEYRGYDSVGVATLYDSKIVLKKGVGKVAEANERLRFDQLPGTIGLGHTRWATHGGVTDANAHPHLSNSNRIAIVHNGIIDNYSELKRQLKRKGYFFRSETDSEVIAILLQEKFDSTGDVREAMMWTVSHLEGSYAFIALFEDGTLAAARFREPLIIGVGEEGYFIASDVLGFVEHTDRTIFVADRHFVISNSTGMKMFNFDGTEVDYNDYDVARISRELAGVQKGDYAHFTLKEIYEQSFTFPRAADDSRRELDIAVRAIRDAENVYITGSGTSYHACLVAQYLFLKYAKIRLEPIIASEAKFYPHRFDDKSVLIAVSQSGESADVLETVSLAKKENAKIISTVNVMTSSLVHESSIALGLNCGPEIGVAATKSFTSQLAVFYKMVERLCPGQLELNFGRVSKAISEVLSEKSFVEDLAKGLRGISDIYILGRGIHYPIALEAALKMKEITYIHAEALPGGELKHGPLALLDSNSFVVIINPSDETYVDTLAGAHEIKARGGKIIGISDRPNEIYDFWIRIPKVENVLFPVVEIVPIQLLAYHTALERRADPDYPRNLAKCVTVK